MRGLTWFGWVLILRWLVVAIVAILNVGRPATPVSPVHAAGVVLAAITFTVGVLAVGTGRL